MSGASGISELESLDRVNFRPRLCCLADLVVFIFRLEGIAGFVPALSTFGTNLLFILVHFASHPSPWPSLSVALPLSAMYWSRIRLTKMLSSGLWLNLVNNRPSS